MSDSNPNVVGINVLKQNGLDVDELVKELIQNAAVEFTAYYYFTNLRAHCTGMEGEGLKGIIEDARLEDLSHFEACLERIYQLGGILPNDATEFIKISGSYIQEYLNTIMSWDNRAGRIIVPNTDLTLAKKSYCYRASSQWNSLPENIRRNQPVQVSVEELDHPECPPVC